MCKGSGHVDEPATPCTPGSACDAALGRSPSLTTLRRSSKGLVLFTRTEDEELALLKPEDLSQVSPTALEDSDNGAWETECAANAVQSRESSCGSSAAASADLPQAVVLDAATLTAMDRDGQASSAIRVQRSLPMRNSDVATCSQASAEAPKVAHPFPATAQASTSRHVPSTCSAATVPERAAAASVLRRWSSPGGPGDIAMPAPDVGLLTESVSAVWEAPTTLADSRQNSYHAQAVSGLERRLSLDVESVRTRISLYKKVGAFLC